MSYPPESHVPEPPEERFWEQHKLDPVNHPAHYTSHPSGVECITITEHMSFLIGNVIKYVWRADGKNGVEDLRKARWYLDREIAKREPVAADDQLNAVSSYPPNGVTAADETGVRAPCGFVSSRGDTCTKPLDHKGVHGMFA
jgi:hypothetical protein